MKHIMIDIETLGTKPGCVVFQIGGCAFDVETGKARSPFFRCIDTVDAEREGLAVEPETAEWWEKKGGIELKQPGTLREVLCDFTEWLMACNAGELWSWGMDFDFPVLEAAFEVIDRGAPWRYYQVNDARTIWKTAYPGVKHPPRTHDALGDCLDQVRDLCDAVAKMGGRTSDSIVNEYLN